MKNELFVTAGEVAQELGVSKPFAYKLVRQMNERHTQISNNQFSHFPQRTGRNRSEVMERNIHAYDEDVKWQLAEPGIDERKELLGSKGTSACGEVKRGSKKDDYQIYDIDMEGGCYALYLCGKWSLEVI